MGLESQSNYPEQIMLTKHVVSNNDVANNSTFKQIDNTHKT